MVENTENVGLVNLLTCASLTLECQKMFFEMHQGLENVFATKERPGLQNARVRINVPPTPNLQNAILAFFGNICGSLLNKSVLENS